MYLVPTIHPAAVMRTGQPISPFIAQDFLRARQISEEGFDPHEYILWVHPANPIGLDVAFQAAIQWIRAWREMCSWVAVDVEASGLDYFDCKLHSLALAGDDGSGVALSFTLCDMHTLPWDMEQALVREAKDLLADPRVGKVYHNAPYDKALLHRKRFPIRGDTFDTLGGMHLIQPASPAKDLGWVGHTWTTTEPWKLNHDGHARAFTQDIVELLIYNAKDAHRTVACRAPLIRDIHGLGMNDRLIQLQMGLADLATQMEIAGLPVNLEKRRRMGLKLMETYEGNLRKLREILQWADFNPNAKGQVREVLFGPKYARPPWNLGLQSTQLTEKERLPSTSYKAIIDHMEHPVVRMLVDYDDSSKIYAAQYREGLPQEIAKLKELARRGVIQDLEGRIKKLEKNWEQPGAYQRAIGSDNRIHCRINPCGQKGSRLATSPNVQNQRPLDLPFIEPVDGRCLVGIDKDQLELRIIACLAGVQKYLEVLHQPGGDPHRLTAAQVYGDRFLKGTPEDQSSIRGISKYVVYASLYSGGEEVVFRTIRNRKELSAEARAAITRKQVRYVYHGWHLQFPEIRRYHEAKYQRVRETGYQECQPFGRRRYYPIWPAPFKEICNWEIQTCGSDFVGDEAIQIQDELLRRFHGTAFLVLHKHDELQVECQQSDAPQVAEIMNRIFGNSRLDGPLGPVYLTGEAIVGRNLYESKKGKPSKEWWL